MDRKPKGDGSVITSYVDDQPVYAVQFSRVVDGKRKRITKKGFASKKDAEAYRRKAAPIFAANDASSIKELDALIAGKPIKTPKDKVTTGQLWQEITTQRDKNIKAGINTTNRDSIYKEYLSESLYRRYSIFFQDREMPRGKHNVHKMVKCKPRMQPIINKPWADVDVYDLLKVLERCRIPSDDTKRALRAVVNWISEYAFAEYKLDHNPYRQRVIKIKSKRTSDFDQIAPVPESFVELCWDLLMLPEYSGQLTHAVYIGVGVCLISSYSGMRCKELRAVRPHMVSFDDKKGGGTIVGAGCKTRKGIEMPIHFMSPIDGVISAFFLGPHGNLFSDYSSQGLRYCIRTVAKFAAQYNATWQVEYERNKQLYDKINPHQCRHRFGTLVAKSFGEGGIQGAALFLRHTDINLTRKYYVWLDQQEAIGKLQELGKKDKSFGAALSDPDAVRAALADGEETRKTRKKKI